MNRAEPAKNTTSVYQQYSQNILETALREVPGYDSWRRFDPGPHVPLDERYAALPVLRKQDLRDHFPLGFIPRARNLEQGLAEGAVEFAMTSGSTDDQVTLVFDASWWEASERAAWQLNEHARRVASGMHREVVMASPRCVGPGYSAKPLSTRERTIGRHLYLNQKINPASWTRVDMLRMIKELNDYQPLVLEADPAYLAPFARQVAEQGLKIHQPKLIFLTYSFPARVYLRQIRDVFNAPLASSYGSTETGHVFMECEAGRLHQNSEHCRVDFQPWLFRHGGPWRGQMLVTVFHNPWFVALRFDIGDVARLDDRGPCPCGRNNGLTLAASEGRVKDVTFTSEGRPVTVADLDTALAAITELNGWQLELPEPGNMQMNILVSPRAASKVRREVSDILHSIYGSEISYEVVKVTALQHEASGKFRFARTAFPISHEMLLKAV